MRAQRTVNDSSGSGCVVIFIALLALAAVFWVFSAIGNFLGLTPTFDEVTNRPDGWVTRHYAGVVWGYILTGLLIAAVAAVLWFALMTQDAVKLQALQARYLLPRVAGFALSLLLVALLLPIGERTGVQTASGGSGEGNAPDLLGQDAGEAERTLQAEGLIAQFTVTPIDNAQCDVVDQQPRAGSELEQGAIVTVRCEERVPDVVGSKADTGNARLRGAGFSPQLVNEPSDYDLTRCRVQSQSPTGQALPYATVSLRLECTEPEPEPEPEPLPELEPEPEPTEDCDENYSGACVPLYPPDVDCPDVDGPVDVTGEDVHALDREGDGSACE